MLADELLGALHAQGGHTQATYAEPPVRFDGGYFTENHAFRLADAPPPFDGPLVVRLFPSTSPPDLPRREAAVQSVLSDQGYPAPPVVLFDEDARLAGRRFFVMARLAGRPILGGIRIRELATSGRHGFTRLADMTARMQAWLHRLDANPLLEQLGDAPSGVERWFDRIDTQAQNEFDGLRGGLRCLIDHRPQETGRSCICHGDLWGGNILADGDRVTGVLDYTVATVAEPALDVGFTAMSLCLAPIDASRPMQRAAARMGQLLCKRYVGAYQREANADLSNQQYYEALRCVSELTGVVAFRLAESRRQPHDMLRPTWDSISDQMIDYFRARTGVTLQLPDPVARAERRR